MAKGVAKLGGRYPSKRAFITGAGSGLGLAFAKQLAQQQWNIAITDINADRLRTTSELLQELGATSCCYGFDVSDHKAFADAVSDFASGNNRIDIGINNAGIGCGGALDETAIETFQRVIDINLMGTANGCHLFIPVMKKQGNGHILNVASAAAFVSPPLMSAYSASKAAVVALSETLYTELHDYAIDVSVLMPAYVRTNIGKDCIGSDYVNTRARILVEESTVTADMAVEETYDLMAQRKLYIILPENARFFWRLKRLMPNHFRELLRKEAHRQFERLNQLIK